MKMKSNLQRKVEKQYTKDNHERINFSPSPSKAELQAMLTEAAANTAKEQNEKNEKRS